MELNPIRSVAARDCEADGKVKGAQLHVLCGWDDPDTYKDAKVSCISKSKEFHWICLHALAVCVFIVRGLRILTYRSDVKGAFIRFAFAACYLLVGVVLPSWSHSLQDSSPVECIRKYCDNTSELVHNSKRRWNTELLDSSVCSTFFSVACVVAQISRLLSLVCPLRMVLLFVSDYKHQALFFGMSEDTYQRVAFSMSLIGVIGMMAFIGGPFSARGCCTDAVQRSTFIVEGLISEIENEGKSIEYLWQRHFLINKALLKVWHCRSVGGIWATRIFVHLMVSLCLGAYTMRGIIQSTPLMIVCAIVSAAMGFSLVFRMANVTYLCESRRS